MVYVGANVLRTAIGAEIATGSITSSTGQVFTSLF
jgi:hypothetical protein